MVFPRFWWLLAFATLGQGMAFAALGLSRWRGGKMRFPWRWWAVCFWLGACAGAGYGFVQRDPVFVAGQFFAVILFMITSYWNKKE